MCGINGILRLSDAAPAIDPGELLRTRDVMTAHGPDGSGFWIDGDPPWWSAGTLRPYDEREPIDPARIAAVRWRSRHAPTHK